MHQHPVQLNVTPPGQVRLQSRSTSLVYTPARSRKQACPEGMSQKQTPFKSPIKGMCWQVAFALIRSHQTWTQHRRDGADEKTPSHSLMVPETGQSTIRLPSSRLPPKSAPPAHLLSFCNRLGLLRVVRHPCAAFWSPFPANNGQGLSDSPPQEPRSAIT